MSPCRGALARIRVVDSNIVGEIIITRRRVRSFRCTAQRMRAFKCSLERAVPPRGVAESCERRFIEVTVVVNFGKKR